MKYKLLFSVFFIFLAQLSFAQIKPLSVAELENRMALGKDTTYVVNFWATWCSPCIEELPYFEALNEKYKGDKVAVLLISLDFQSKLESSVKPFLKRIPLKSEVYILNESNQQEFIEKISESWSGAIPATLFVKGAGKERKFYEKEFKFKDLEDTLLSFRNN